MSAPQPTGSAKRKLPKLDVAQVSLNLQDRLGLAKVRYERVHRRRMEPLQPIQQGGKRGPGGGEIISDSSSEISDNNRYETPFTSSPLPTPMLSKELSRSARSKHAAMFIPSSMDSVGGSRKRGRSNSASEQPMKAPRLSWKTTNNLPQSSPAFNRQHGPFRHDPHSFVSESDTIPEENSPLYQRRSDDMKDSDLPIVKVQNVSSSMISSSPPRTPPPNRNRAAQSGKEVENGEDGADLLLYLANSPTPVNFRRNNTHDLLPSTPPSQHAVLPSLMSTPGGGVTANFGTPTQQFNFADFVNVTPSPAQLPWGGRTPGGRTPGALSRTPRPPKELRKRLNFDSLAPPTGSPSTTRDKKIGLALQLGEELRP
ncbi:hypothetical protein FQN55_009455 [Onygenales sp. PD_40]|nr:hypothetical protein FQN55_009455 [Onygenales sp. PD_40]